MKKIIKILIIIALIFPFNIFACPHFDEDGNMYFMYYDSEDYNATILFYPRGDYHQEYKYITEVLTGEYIDEKPMEAILFEENFEIPLYRVRDIYDFDSPFATEGDPIFQDADFISINGENFDLNVDISTIKDEILPSNLNEISTASFLINQRIVNKDSEPRTRYMLTSYLEEIGVSDFYDNFYSFRTGQTIVDDKWQETKLYYTEIINQITLTKEVEFENPRVILIEGYNRRNLNISEVESVYEDGKITFDVSNTGFYSIVNSEDEIEATTLRNNSDEIVDFEDKAMFKTPLVISGGAVLFALVLVATNKIK